MLEEPARLSPRVTGKSVPERAGGLRRGAESTELSTFSWASLDHGNLWSELHKVDWQIPRAVPLYLQGPEKGWLLPGTSGEPEQSSEEAAFVRTQVGA